MTKTDPIYGSPAVKTSRADTMVRGNAKGGTLKGKSVEQMRREEADTNEKGKRLDCDASP